MGYSLSVLDHVRVASPCKASWAEMTGDDRVRFCSHCEKNVYNLIDMSREQVEALILAKEGHLCVRYHARRDGTILTSDCPVGLRWVRHRLRTVGVFCSAVLLMLLEVAWAIGLGGSERGISLRRAQPFEYLLSKLAPSVPSPTLVMGAMICPPLQPAESSPNGNSAD